MKLRLPSRLRLLSILQVNGLHSHFIQKKKDQSEECVCKNCSTHFTGNFCPVCGQSRKVHRLTFLSMLQDGISVFTNLDNGLFRTITELYWRPGYMIRDYIQGKQKGYMKPLSLLFCLSTFYYIFLWLVSKDALASIDLGHEQVEILENYEKYKPLIETAKDYVDQWLHNPGLVVLTFILPMAPAAWLCFRKTRLGKAFNLMEHFHIQFFTACQLMTMIIVMSVFHWITVGHLSFLDFDFLPSFLLLMWDFKQLYEIRWWRSFRLTALSFFLTLFNILIILAFIIVIFLAYFIATGDLSWYWE